MICAKRRSLNLLQLSFNSNLFRSDGGSFYLVVGKGSYNEIKPLLLYGEWTLYITIRKEESCCVQFGNKSESCRAVILTSETR